MKKEVIIRILRIIGLIAALVVIIGTLLKGGF